jgi:hypothetical protein
MNGDAAGIDRGDAGWSHDRDILLRSFRESAQQCRLAGAGLSGDETMPARVQGKLLGQLELNIGHGAESRLRPARAD